MKIGVVGGTGREGRGMAVRWAKAGHDVFIGSRDGARGAQSAAELSAQNGVLLKGGDNLAAVRHAQLVVLSVPYDAHAVALESLKADLDERIILDITVPLAPPKVRVVHLPPGQAAALEARAILGPTAKLVAALHHVSSAHLSDLTHDIPCDVLACSDQPEALEVALGLIRDLGVRAFDAGPLANAVALESLTPVLLHINKKYKSTGVGIRMTGLDHA